MTGSQISHDLYKYVPLGLLETYKLLLVLYEILGLNTWQKITKTEKEEMDKKSPQHPQNIKIKLNNHLYFKTNSDPRDRKPAAIKIFMLISAVTPGRDDTGWPGGNILQLIEII